MTDIVSIASGAVVAYQKALGTVPAPRWRSYPTPRTDGLSLRIRLG